MQPVFRQVVQCVPEIYGQYRYILEVQLTADPDPTPGLAVILKNPSTADLTRRDPTIGKVEAWARRQGFGRLSYVNLFALRSTQPAPLNLPTYDLAVGPDNDRFIREAVASAVVVVAAWGNANGIEPARYDRRIAEVLHLLDPAVRLQVVGPPTRQGYPRHGLLWNHRPTLADYDLHFARPGRL